MLENVFETHAHQSDFDIPTLARHFAGVLFWRVTLERQCAVRARADGGGDRRARRHARRRLHEGVSQAEVNATRWNRREVLGGVLAAGALGSAPLRLGFAQQPADTMSERSEFLIRNAYVLTMDAAVGDIAGGDVHVRAGAIAAVGRGLTAPGAEVIDGAGMLVLPGFVETHWHVWTTLLRSLSGDRAGARLLSDVREPSARSTRPTTCTRRGGSRRPRPCTRASRSCTTGATTFVTPAYAEAALRALAEAGIRARFSYGSPTGASNDASIDLARSRAAAASVGTTMRTAGC